MKTTVTLTSKRQLTIPKKLWQTLHLDGIRYLEAEVENGNLKLSKVSFDKQIQAFWHRAEGSVNGPLDDDSIKRAARKARRNRPLA